MVEKSKDGMDSIYRRKHTGGKIKNRCNRNIVKICPLDSQIPTVLANRKQKEPEMGRHDTTPPDNASDEISN